MGDFYGLKKNGETFDCNDATARSSISVINEKIPSGASSSNKLVDTTAMNNAIGQAVSAAYKPAGTKTAAELVSGLLVAANKGNVYNITTAGTTTADFVEGVGKPIRVGDNVGICEPTSGTFKFDLLSGFVAVDENPTAGSANPVSSGGVKTALDSKVDKVTGKGLSKNDYTDADKAVVSTAQDNIKANTKLIKDTVGWSGKNKLKTGIGASGSVGNGTWKINSDSSVTINATLSNITITPWRLATGGVSSTEILTESDIPHGTYKIIWLNANGQKNSNIRLQIFGTNGALNQGTEIANSHNNDTVTIDNTYSYYYARIWINAGTINDTMYGMLIDEDILDFTYEPYFGSTAFPRSEQAVLGAKNLHPKYKNVTSGNAVMSVDDDGICTITGTSASGDSILSEFVFDLPAGRYTLTDEAIHTNVAYCQIQNVTKSVIYWTPNNNATFEYNGTDTLKARIWLKGGSLTLNEVLKPMIRIATDPDDTYVPYAMTNKELTEKKVDKVTAILTSNDDLDDIMESGLYSITSKPANSPNQWCTMLVIGGRNDNISQIIFMDYGNDGFIYIRSHGGNPAVWQPWIKFTGTVVS